MLKKLAKKYNKKFLEESNANEFGVECYGNLISVSISNLNASKLPMLEIKGEKLLNFKRFKDVSMEYKEGDTEKLREIWQEIFKKAEKQLCKAVKHFEIELNSIIKQIEKETNKY